LPCPHVLLLLSRASVETVDIARARRSLQGCDASVLLSGPDDEHSAGADTTLSPDALDLVTRAKAAVDADAQCANKVSCADILALAARDVVSQVHTGSRPPRPQLS
jgi:hypothetical protein